jgi:riboflavin kinase/FMN adenylyltransferase
MVVTFDPHPATVLRREIIKHLLIPLSKKLQLFEHMGIQAALVLPFDACLWGMSASQFVEEVLVQRLHAREVHEGWNFRFGSQAKGDVSTLSQLGRKFGFDVKIYAQMHYLGEIVSSSRIRQLLAEGDVHRAEALLGWGEPPAHMNTGPTDSIARPTR